MTTDDLHYSVKRLAKVMNTGKSVLASYIIEECRKHPDVSVAYFYFAHRDPLRDNFFAMATTLAAQLMQDETLVDYFHKAMRDSTSGLLPNKVEASTLLEFTLRVRKTFVVLDGIDECSRDERKHICSWFRSVIDNLDRTKQDEIRCLFLSQEDGFAKKDLSMIPTFKMTPEHNKKDILSLSQATQARIETEFGGPCRLGPQGLSIADVVTGRANGMFIYAELVLHELETYPTPVSLQDEWSPEKFPEKLSDV